MKIACQSCQAKYTIADEKVLGRVVKIRCKKCGATIVINGNEPGDAAAQMPEEQTILSPNSRAAFDYAAPQTEEPWTVNVADGDQRTLTTADIVAQFKAGVVNDETYCWKDGMGDWLPLREIEQLAGACGLGADAPAASAPYAAPASVPPAGLGALFAGGGDAAGAYAASPAEANGNGAAYGAAASPAPAAARRVGGRAGGADLFGAAAEAGGENDVMTSAPQGAPAMHAPDNSKLVGQRNENSVLFSLNALTQNAPKEETPGPQGDGSGLIDIRALSANMAPKEKKANHVDDIMNLGGGGAFSAALAAPVLAPPPVDAGDVYGQPAAQSGKSNKMMFVILAVGLAVVVLLVLVLLRKPDAPAASATPAGGTATTGSNPVAANDTSTAPATTGVPPASAAMGAAPSATATGPAPVDPTKSAVAVAPATPHHGGGTSHSSGGGSPAAADPTPAPAAPAPASGGGSSLDQAMKNAVPSTGGGAAAPSTGSSAPFDRGAASGALGGVNVASCKRPDGPTGPGHVQVTFAPDGSVSTANVDQPPYAGTAVGGCVAGKFRGARIPAFAGSSVKVGKSFVIN
jgi:predicted Zn finger-like uncharacterized protein